MKLKKLLVVLLSGMLIFGLTACGGGNETPESEAPPAGEETTDESTAENSPPTIDGPTTPEDISDGSYRAEGDSDEHGWVPYVELEVAGGEITAVEFDYSNNGALKSEDEEYIEMMESVSGVSPADFTKAYGEALVETQDITAVDVISGATQSHARFQSVASKALSQGQ